jgi:hypothetical protein
MRRAATSVLSMTGTDRPRRLPHPTLGETGNGGLVPHTPSSPAGSHTDPRPYVLIIVYGQSYSQNMFSLSGRKTQALRGLLLLGRPKLDKFDDSNRGAMSKIMLNSYAPLALLYLVTSRTLLIHSVLPELEEHVRLMEENMFLISEVLFSQGTMNGVHMFDWLHDLLYPRSEE